MKKNLSVLLVLVLTLSVLPLSVFVVNAAESETGETIAVSDVAGFLGMTAGNSYYLANDIDFGGAEYSGSLLTAFAGVLDGKGHTISNFTIKYESGELADGASAVAAYVGVFGQLGGTCATVISNLNIGTAEKPITLTVNAGNANSKMGIGFLAGQTLVTYAVDVDHVNVYGKLENTTFATTGDLAVGGFIGEALQLTLTNSTMNGTIAVTRNGEYKNFIGGMVGLLSRNSDQNRITVKKCVNNAAVSLTAIDASQASIGGIAAVAKSNMAILNCTNNGNVTGPASNGRTGGIVGRIMPATVASLQLFLIADCTNGGAITGNNNYKNEIVGYMDVNYADRLCVVGCSAQNSAGLIELSSADDFARIGNDAGYPVTGFYTLKNDIDFSGKTYSTCVIPYFNGVLYGAGHTIKNLSLRGSGDMGFISYLAGDSSQTAGSANEVDGAVICSHAAILDLNFGTADIPVNLTDTGANKTVGVVASYSGYNGKYNAKSYLGAWISNVDIYENVGITGQGGTIGGLIGRSGSTVFLDCNVFGSVTVKDHESKDFQVGAFIAFAEYVNTGSTQNGNHFVGCNNFADISVNYTESAKSQYIGGFIGTYDSRNAIFVSSNNFGNISHAAGGSTDYVSAFVGYTKKEANILAVECANFGVLSGSYCTTLLSLTTDNAKTRLYGVGVSDYGSVSAIQSVNRYVYYTGNQSTIQVSDCEAETLLEMQNGASVKIDPQATGLRFRANISPSAIEKLSNIFGNGKVSYGILITPEAYISAAGDFTIAALDSFAAARAKQFDGKKAYIDIPATKWFVGSNGEETGVIAAAIVDMTSLYQVKFCGRAYLKIAVDENNTVLLYSDYSIANNSRSVQEVTAAAINDVLYQKGGDFFRYQNGAYVAVENNGKYVTNVGKEGEYTKFSRYTATEYETLTNLLASISS